MLSGGACCARRASLAAALPHAWLRLADAHTTDGASDEALRCAVEGAEAAEACGDRTSQVRCRRKGCVGVSPPPSSRWWNKACLLCESFVSSLWWNKACLLWTKCNGVCEALKGAVPSKRCVR